MPRSVLDASALLAYLRLERGAERVRDAIAGRAAIGIVSWAETLSKLFDLGEEPEAVQNRLAEERILGISLVVWPFSESLAVEVARLRPVTRHAGLSLGDRACLALAYTLRLPVLTAERLWSELPLGLDVRQIR